MSSYPTAIQKIPHAKYYKCESVEEKINIDFSWVIGDFMDHTEKKGEFFNSSPFPSGGDIGNWYLSLYPRGSSKNKEEYISLYLNRTKESPQPESKVKAVFFIVDDKGGINKIADFLHIFQKGYSQGSGYPTFLKRNFLIDNEKFFLTNGKLRLYFQFTFYKKMENILIKNNHVEDNIYDLSTDLSTLFKSKNLSDVTFWVQGKEIDAHKIILSARSSVFSAMFAHDMKENQDHKVEIHDISYEVLSEMLHFIYTGRSPNLRDLADDLFVAADKYDLLGLKQICEDYIADYLTTEKAIGTLILSDKHSALSLKSKTIRFIKSSLQDVMNAPGWSELINNHPKLIEEIFQSFV